MKKKIISGMLSVLMLASVSVSNLAFAENSATIPAISFVDESGNAVTSAPDLGKIKIADIGGAGAKFFATYDKDGRFREMSDSDTAVYVNEWAEDTYVKAFAFNSLEGIKSIAPAKKVELSTEGKELIVSYADGLPTVSESDAYKNTTQSTVQTYGNAKYSAKRGGASGECGTALSESAKTALAGGTYNVVKIRYYVEDKNTNRFALGLGCDRQLGTVNNVKKPFRYSTVIPENNGWNVATVNLENMTLYNCGDSTLSHKVESSTHFKIICDTNSILGYDNSNQRPNQFNTGLYIDSIWLDNEKLEIDHAIDFSSDNDWNVVTVNHLTKSTEQKYGTATQSAKVTKASDNWNYFFDLAKMGFTTNWLNYKVLKIRYYTNDVSAVPPVYLATGEGWVTVGGDIYNGSTKLKDNQGSYVLKKGTLDNTKPSETGWNTVSYILPTVSERTDFGANAIDNNISMCNIPYMLIPTDGNSQWYLDKDNKYVALSGEEVTVYIDKIWLEGDLKLDDNTVIDFGNAYTWNVVETNFYKSTDYKDTNKQYTAKMESGDTSNVTGYIDLKKIGFTTNWSDYKTISIRYYTKEIGATPAVYLSSTNSNWVTSNGLDGTAGCYRLNKCYDSKKSTSIGWNTVTYKLPTQEDSDFYAYGDTSKINTSSISYLMIPTHELEQYWNDNSVDCTEVASNVWLDSIWLSK